MSQSSSTLGRTSPPRSPSVRKAVVAALVLVPAVVSLGLLAGPAPNLAVLTRDMADTAGIPPWLGFLSFVGILYWAGAGAIALFASTLASGPDGDARFLAVLGVALAILAIDDLFMLHELVVPSLGVPEPIPKVTYVLAVALFAVVYRSRFVGVDRLLAIAAAGAFATSLLVNAVTNGGNPSSATEGCLKLAGITIVLVLTVRLSRAAVDRARPSTS